MIEALRAGSESWVRGEERIRRGILYRFFDLSVFEYLSFELGVLLVCDGSIYPFSFGLTLPVHAVG